MKRQHSKQISKSELKRRKQKAIDDKKKYISLPPSQGLREQIDRELRDYIKLLQKN